MQINYYQAALFVPCMQVNVTASHNPVSEHDREVSPSARKLNKHWYVAMAPTG